ncbi:small ribosomal subunit protein mS23 [Parasteatoda tepidariorum]|uniref:small ribosomal subunit protein mS23 n=1 Tax=Parasteatoda tepidariorum TaxID=114398 RepID=UPI00077FD792|nr:28S ribosomal protein S23, mitochondrial [Parasteatoda tepidariorum]XP_015913931.1 28S ribosomal protein S23, mitochondrial [Parasteatoda tepidariorum]XP_042907200.1 28S ribosomal protein S23, mitochondrial [Parasteatoda tepidariorum]
MAGNRLQRTGSIFERLSGLLKTGAIKGEDKPIWYDVYKSFPPKHEPTFSRPPLPKEIKPIFYPEDNIRGKFLKLYGPASVHNLLQPSEQSIMQRFVEKYQYLEKNGSFMNEEDVFKATEAALEEEGITFMRTKEKNFTDENS